MTTTPDKNLYRSPQDIRWCPGCGDYAILKVLQNLLKEQQAPVDNTVFISGIGCAARLPYYMPTHGFHTLHGRALPIAIGTKLANPKLDVWVISGDGDALSIGAHHFIHTIRKNPTLTFLLFNNGVYGLTKGQASATAPLGLKTPSSPYGQRTTPLSPLALSLGSQAAFFARSVDTAQEHLMQTLKAAQKHRGFAVVEILQNCIVFNNRPPAKMETLFLEHGKPLLFSSDNQPFGLRFHNGQLTPIPIDKASNWKHFKIAQHDTKNRTLAFALSELKWPLILGVITEQERLTLEDIIKEDIKQSQKSSSTTLLQEIKGVL